jgi:hypothetical protein
MEETIDAHGLKIHGRGYLKCVPKPLRGSRLSGKVPLFLGIL